MVGLVVVVVEFERMVEVVVVVGVVEVRLD